MAFLRTRRTVRLGAAVAAAAVISIGFAAIPAQASDADQSYFLFAAPDAQTLLPASGGVNATTYRTIEPMVLAETGEVTNVRIAIDGSGLANVAELSLPAGKQCSYTDQAKLQAVCLIPSAQALDPVSVDLGIRAADGAAVGAKGSISFKVTADNAVEDPSVGDDTTEVTIGDGADLAVKQLGDFTAKAGTSTSFTPQVSNLGDQDADGVVMFLGTESMSTEDSFGIGGNYSNCLYGVSDDGEPSEDGSAGVLCRFDSTVVKPGEVMVPSDPALVNASASATNGAVIYGFDVSGGPLDTGTTGGTKGTGPALTLVPVPASSSLAHSIDIDYDNNVAASAIKTNLVDDVTAIAESVHGTVGQSLPLTVGLKNTGNTPTVTLPEPGAPKNDTGALAVLFPEGVKISHAPKDCESVDLSDLSDLSASRTVTGRSVLAAATRSGRLAGLTSTSTDGFGAGYACIVDRVLQPGQTADFTFTIKPTKVLSKALGAVLAVDQPDANPDHAVATFTVSAVKAGATASASPVSDTSSSPAADSSATPSPSSTGNLARTGGGDDAAPLVGAGAAAILVGAGAVLFARRRKAGSHS